jgi:CDP-paratose 2-epimerase
MRWLVTGGCGVIGSYFVHRVVESGHEAIVIDSMEEPRNVWIAERLPDGAKVYQERIERMPPKQLAEEILSKCDAVLHAAASTGIPYSVTSPTDDLERNIDSTRVLLEASRRIPKPTVVLSSVKPYRVTSETAMRGLNENDVLEPDEPYAASKAAQSMLAQAYARSYDLPITVFRCSNLYGPAPCHGARHGWLTHFCIQAALGNSIRVEGSGDQSRDMLHASDVASAVLKTIDRLYYCTPGMRSVKGEIFNLGGGASNRISVNQAAKFLQELTGVPIVNAPARAMDDAHVFADCTKYTSAVAWTPQVNVIDGMRDVLAWAQRHKDSLCQIYAEQK